MHQLQIDSHQVHLWHLHVPERDDDATCEEKSMALLAPEERERHGRFHFARDRRRYLMTRGLIRSLLSCYAPIAPKDWQFENNAYGRPRIANALPQAQRLRFNISHSASLIVAALTVEREVGVDVEHTARNAPLEIAENFFSAREAKALQQLPAGLQPSRFWDLWTLKESYIKARGMGLSLPLDRFSFSFDDAHSVAIDFEDGLEDSAARWQFWQFQPDNAHAVALCLERTQPQDVQILCWKATPLLTSFGEFQGSVTRRSAGS